MMSWIYLLIAGIFEICFTTTLKMSDGFSKVWPTVLFAIFSVLSFWSLNKSLEGIPLGIAYAVWTGIGAAGTVVLGSMFFGEHLNAWQITFIVTLILSIFGLKVLA